MKILQTIILLFYFSSLFSQKEAILKNPDIIWAAEVETDFIVDNYTLAEKNENNLIYTLKMLGKDANLMDNNSYYLSELFTDAVFSNKVRIFSDKNLGQLTDTFAMISRDTITPCDGPVDYLPYRIFLNRKDPDRVNYFRIHQILFYNFKKSKWNIETISVAPLEDITDQAGDFITKEPLYWMKTFNKKPKLNSENIIWAKRLSTKKNCIDLDSVKVFKGASLNPMAHFIDAFKNNPQLRIYSSDDFSDKKKLTLAERAQVISKVDSFSKVYTFENVKNQGWEMKVVSKELDLTKVRKLRLVQNWFWDDKKNQLAVWLEAVAPRIRLEDYEGNLFYEYTLFYQRNDD